MPSEWIRPKGCESGPCVEYRIDGSAVYVHSSALPSREIGFTVAEWDTFVAGLVAGARCICATGPDFEGPSAECAIHGAVRALNETIAERDQLRENLITECAQSESLASELAGAHTIAQRANARAETLAAENARVRQDVDRYKRWLATANKELNAVQVELAITSDQLSDSRAMCGGHVDERDLHKAIAEAAVLRHRDRRTQAVVEAAMAWFDHRRGSLNALADALDNLQNGPSSPPGSTESNEQSQPVAQPTGGPDPQGEAQEAMRAFDAALKTLHPASCGCCHARVWNAGDPEPEDVEKVRDCDGDPWSRSSDGSCAWKCEAVTATSGPIDWDFVLTWAPLTEVLPEPTPTVTENDPVPKVSHPVPCACASCARARWNYGVADYTQPLTDFERRAGVIDPTEVPEAGRASEAQTITEVPDAQDETQGLQQREAPVPGPDRSEVRPGDVDATPPQQGTGPGVSLPGVQGLAPHVTAEGRTGVGLDAAIEAAIATGQHYESEPETDDDESYCICGDLWVERHAAEVFVRAASPLIERAALQAAADELEASPWLGHQSAAKRIRDRAPRTETP